MTVDTSSAPMRRRQPLPAIQLDDHPRRKRRLRAGLSLREVEKLSGVNRGLLSMWERGMTLPPDIEAAIAAALNKPTT